MTPLHDKRKLLALLCALGKQVRKAIKALSFKDAQYLSPHFTQWGWQAGGTSGNQAVASLSAVLRGMERS